MFCACQPMVLNARLTPTAVPSPEASAVLCAAITPALAAESVMSPSAVRTALATVSCTSPRIALVAITPVSAKEAALPASAVGCRPLTTDEMLAVVSASANRSPPASRLAPARFSVTALATSFRATRPPKAGPPALAASSPASAVIAEPSRAERRIEPVAWIVGSAVDRTETATPDLIRLPASTRPAPSVWPSDTTRAAMVDWMVGRAMAAISILPATRAVTSSSVTRVTSGSAGAPTAVPSSVSKAVANRFPGCQPRLLKAIIAPTAASPDSTPPSTEATTVAAFVAAMRRSPLPLVVIPVAAMSTVTAASTSLAAIMPATACCGRPDGKAPKLSGNEVATPARTARTRLSSAAVIATSPAATRVAPVTATDAVRSTSFMAKAAMAIAKVGGASAAAAIGPVDVTSTAVRAAIPIPPADSIPVPVAVIVAAASTA